MLKEIDVLEHEFIPHYEFTPNKDGDDAVYWQGATGTYYIFSKKNACHCCILSLQSEWDIFNFAKAIFDFDDENPPNYEEALAVLNLHEGEWFDLPEELLYHDSYEETSFESLYLGVIDEMFVGEDSERNMIFTECHPHVPNAGKWRTYKRKVWVRMKICESKFYFGPYENFAQAARGFYTEYLFF